MKSRERIKRTFERKEIDRPAIDIGGTTNSGISIQAYTNLAGLLGLKQSSKKTMDVWSLAAPEEEVLRKLSVDTRAVVAPTPDVYQNIFTRHNKFTDEWGLVYEKPEGCIYYELIYHPLANAEIDDLEKYAWPNPVHPGRIQGVKEYAKTLYDNGEYAIIGTPSGGTSLFERSWYLRGMEQFLVDLVINKEFAHALLETILDLQIKKWEVFLGEVGKYLDVVPIGDDLAGQQNTIISPDLYREMIKPYQKRYFHAIKQLTDAKLLYHSCGNISSLLGDLIEIGIDAINPVQTSANDMDPEKLKAEFGDKLVFWGAVDTHELLNHASQEEVINTTRKLVKILGNGGGYVVAANHNIQPDVKPENIIAMVSAVVE